MPRKPSWWWLLAEQFGHFGGRTFASLWRYLPAPAGFSWWCEWLCTLRCEFRRRIIFLMILSYDNCNCRGARTRAAVSKLIFWTIFNWRSNFQLSFCGVGFILMKPGWDDENLIQGRERSIGICSIVNVADSRCILGKTCYPSRLTQASVRTTDRIKWTHLSLKSLWSCRYPRTVPMWRVSWVSVGFIGISFLFLNSLLWRVF